MTTYNEIVSRIQGITQEDGSELTQALPYLIEQAERKITKDLDIDALITHSTVNTVAATTTVAKPATAMDVRQLRSAHNALEFRTLSFCQEYADKAASALPLFYSNYDKETLYLAPTPNAIYPLTMEYELRLTGLTVTNQNTYLSDYQTELLTYAILVETAVFNKQEVMQKMYETEYQYLLASTKTEVAKLRSDVNVTWRK